MEGMRTALLVLALSLLPGLASADSTAAGQGGQSMSGAVTPANTFEFPLTAARRGPRCRRVCAQRERVCETRRRCNYVTNKCRNVRHCRTYCSYYETVPVNCVP